MPGYTPGRSGTHLPRDSPDPTRPTNATGLSSDSTAFPKTRKHPSSGSEPDLSPERRPDVKGDRAGPGREPPTRLNRQAFPRKLVNHHRQILLSPVLRAVPWEVVTPHVVVVGRQVPEEPFSLFPANRRRFRGFQGTWRFPCFHRR
jgi:hypothetical protein